MKKEKIYNIVVATICFALWFMPIHLTGYNFTLKTFFAMIINGNFIYLFPYTIREILIIVLGCTAIVLSILQIIKDNDKIKLLAAISSGLYVIMWIIAIFVQFPGRLTIFIELSMNANTYIIWLLLYFVMFLSIIALTVLQYIHTHHQSKTKRLQAQIDELQKQVDELKKDE